MSEVREFFRHCPACGRRFHIKLVGKKLMGETKEINEIKQAMINRMPMGYLIVEENIPVTIEVKDFRYSYRCKHCGHEWFEAHVQEAKQ